MELRQLRAFVTVANERNFTKAARRLHMSQPPLSRHIAQLERELGVDLLDRSGKRFFLTEAGKLFHEEASRILEEVESCLRRTRLVGGDPESRLRIAASGSLMQSIVPGILASAGAGSGPGSVELFEMSTENQAKAILAGRIDLGFLRNWAATGDLAFEPLGRELLAVVYPEAWTAEGRAFASLGDFAERPFVAGHESQAPGLAEVSRELCAEAGFSPRTSFECDHVAAMLKIVEAGMGWAILPRAIAGGGGVIASVELDAGLSFGVAYRPGRQPARAVAVIEAARALHGSGS